MIHALSLRSKALSVIGGSLLAIVALALAGFAATAYGAEATGYGELTRFGEFGGFEGHLSPGELRARAIGVDPTDNSVYLLDEPKEPTGALNKNRSIRLQKYVANGSGEYSMKASVEFKLVAPEAAGTEPTIEGLVVDPVEKRVYLLVVGVREKQLKHASRTPGGVGVRVASALYAFSTVESGASLVAASGTKTGGLVIGPEELKAQSEGAGEALLQPRGIALDPATHELVLLAHEDKGTEQVDNPTSPKNANDHYVLQRITAKGELGARYVDKTDVFKQEVETPERFPVPDSPVIVSAGAEERAYVHFGGLAEVPYDFSSSTPPKVGAPIEGGVAGGIGGFPEGGGLSASEGTIFGANAAGIKNEEPGGEGRAGVIAFSGQGSELGWTGGGQMHATEPRAKCTISPATFSLLPDVAAGSGGKLFVLAPEFLLREEPGEPEFETIMVENPKGSGEFEEEEIEIPTWQPFSLPGGAFFPAVIEFGPGGAGCPQASATSPVAKVGGIEVENVKPGSEVIFSSQVKQADALEVDWNFGDGKTETVKTDEFQTTSAKHTYTSEGVFTVTETIHSDDFASPSQVIYKEGHLTTPTITVTRTISVGKQPPKAQFVASLAKVGEATLFTSHSTDPNGPEGLPLVASWNFGDGSPTATGATASHAYAAAGTYTVTLTVTDKFGLHGSVSQPVTVTAAPPPGGGGGSGSGGGGGGGGTSTSTNTAGSTSTSTSTTTTSTGQTGVLSYSVSLAGTALTVSKAGALVLKVHCAGQSSCTGSAVLRTATAVSAGAGKRKAIMTLASGSFAIAGGQVKSLTMHLSSKARALLQRLHVLRAKVSIVARDAAGASHTTILLVTLRAAKTHH
jgi:PKD repeat protein